MVPQELQMTGFQKSLFGILTGEQVKSVALHFGHTGALFKINLQFKKIIKKGAYRPRIYKTA